MALNISATTIDDNPALVLSGRIIDVDVKKFHKKLDSISSKNPHIIILDISDVEFIDSHGLGIMIFFHQTLQKDGRKLVIVNRNTDPNSYVARLFDVTNLYQILTIVSDPSKI